MSQNPVAAALAAAAALPDDAAVQTLAEKLRLAQTMMAIDRREPFDPFAGYRRGSAGDEGYGLMHSLDASCFQSMMRDMSHLREIAVVAECLIAVLATRGIEIEY